MARTNKLPKELRKSILRARDYLPEWLRKKYEELDDHPELNEKTNEITDHLVLIKYIWRISDEDYQERIWVNHETLDIVDSYDDSTMYFEEDAENILEARDAGRVKMTDTQYKMLKKLFEMVDLYDDSQERPERDKDIVSDPKWEKIREYAKLVYKELTK